MIVGDFITGNKLVAGNVDTTQIFDVFLFLWFVNNADNIFVADLNDTGKNTRLDLIHKWQFHYSIPVEEKLKKN